MSRTKSKHGSVEHQAENFLREFPTGTVKQFQSYYKGACKPRTVDQKFYSARIRIRREKAQQEFNQEFKQELSVTERLNKIIGHISSIHELVNSIQSDLDPLLRRL